MIRMPSRRILPMIRMLSRRRLPDDQDAQPAKNADDQSAQPSKAANDPDAQPAKAGDDQVVQPQKTVEEQKPQPAQAVAPAIASPPMTPEQVKQRKFYKDSAELLHLIQELKVDVEKAGANTLSLDALRKADEIQKLAKDLKERMKEEGQTFASKP